METDNQRLLPKVQLNSCTVQYHYKDRKDGKVKPMPNIVGFVCKVCGNIFERHNHKITGFIEMKS